MKVCLGKGIPQTCNWFRISILNLSLSYPARGPCDMLIWFAERSGMKESLLYMRELLAKVPCQEQGLEVYAVPISS